MLMKLLALQLVQGIPIVPSKMTIGLSASIALEIVNQSKYALAL